LLKANNELWCECLRGHKHQLITLEGSEFKTLQLKWNNEMKKILHIHQDDKRQLKKRQVIVPMTSNHLFDILAERRTEYALNIPRSKYNKLTLNEIPFSEYFGVVYGHNDQINNGKVWELDYNENDFPKFNEPYLKNYLVKQWEK
jgi:hypothetical protein